MNTDKTFKEIEKLYEGLGKEGHILKLDTKNLTAICARVSKRARLGSKTVFAYRFKSEDRMKEYLVNFYNDRINIQEQRKRAKAERKRKEQEQAQNVKEGDIFCYSWGYEQTNVDFYQVVKRKGKISAVIRPIAVKSVDDTSWASDSVKPEKNAFIGEEETVRLSGNGFKRSCGYAFKVDPKEKHHRSWYA